MIATNARRGTIWFLSLSSFFVAWHVLGTTDRFFWLVPPLEVFSTLRTELAGGPLLAALGQTLWVALLGLLAGCVVGVAVGVLMGTSRRWNLVLEPLVKAAFSTPLVMFVPIIAIYAGLEFQAKFTFTFLFCVFIVIINTAAGIREVPSEALEMARAFEVPPTKLLTKVVVPWAAPYVLTGVRLAVGRSIQGAVIADLFLRAEGVGLYIITAGGSFQLDNLLAAVLLLTLLGAGVMALSRAAEARLLRWKV